MKHTILVWLGIMLLLFSGCSQEMRNVYLNIDFNADQNTVVYDVCNAVMEKAAYGDNLSALNEHERVLYVTQVLEMEVNNGGFSQFFWNSGGDVTNELVSSFEVIGATKTAAICQQAIDAFGCEVPADRDEREELLDAMGDDFDAALSACDDAFYEYEEDLEALNYAYIMAHAESFR